MSLHAVIIASEQLIYCIQGLTESLSNGNASISSLHPCPLRSDEQNVTESVEDRPLSPNKNRKQAGTHWQSLIPETKKSGQNPTTPRAPRPQKTGDPITTSPYFLQTPKGTELVGTPPRRKRGALSIEDSSVASPCFTDSRREQNGSLLKRRRKSATNIVEGEVLPVINPPEFWWEVQELSVKDAVSFTHFRTHSRLYYQLWLAKPTLIQESVSDDPWKLLISVMLLNKTSGKFAIPIFWEILSRWPTPLLLSQADESELMSIIRSLGLQRTRSKRLILLSKMYLDDPPIADKLRPSTFKLFGEQYKPTAVSHLPGSGAYALDSYRIFYSGGGCDPEEWKSVMPSDKELIRYLRWKWAFEGRKKWGPDSGVIGDVDVEYLERLPCLLQK